MTESDSCEQAWLFCLSASAFLEARRGLCFHRSKVALRAVASAERPNKANNQASSRQIAAVAIFRRLLRRELD
jgi:hypothetical protein